MNAEYRRGDCSLTRKSLRTLWGYTKKLSRRLKFKRILIVIGGQSKVAFVSPKLATYFEGVETSVPWFLEMVLSCCA